MIRLMSFVVVFASAMTLMADVKMPSVFSDNMVLQRDTTLNIWGKAAPEEEVTVSFGKQTEKTKADKNGEWNIKLDAVPASKEPAELSVSGKNKLVFKNVLVGDVWLCGGQSNMEWMLNSTSNSKADIEKSKNPLIRHIKINVETSPGQRDYVSSSGWASSDPKSSPGFTAVGYLFAREIVKQTDIPVGIISSNKGGSMIEPWISAATFKKNPEFADISKNVESISLENPKVKERYLQYVASVKAWAEAAQKEIEAGKAINLQPPLFPQPSMHTIPTAYYNAMIYPLAKYPIKGVLWYQGESNAADKKYQAKMTALIENWRELWQQKDMPFYFVQLTAYQPGGLNWPFLRESQLKTAQTVPHTGMAVIIDIGDKNDIHPKNKEDVAQRLAAMALSDLYGKKVPHLSPFFKKLKIEGNKAKVIFDNADNGLCAGVKKANEPFKITEEKIKEFTIAGADKKWYPADSVKIEDDTVIVSSEKVAEPVAVRYAFSAFPEANLYNKDGFPASPFRTDNW